MAFFSLLSHKEIVDTLDGLGGDNKKLNGSGRKNLWKMLKRKFPKCVSQVPVGKKDNHGNLITNHEGLKQLYLKTYVHRLRNRPIRQEYTEIKQLKDELFELRLNLSECNKTGPWTMEDLEYVLTHLKEGKTRDPNGWVNELFSNGVAGKHLKTSLLTLFNKMKMENYIPDFIRKADVATIYKGKGEKCDLENDRGIFLVTTFRSILMRLIYKDKYNTIDENMSDSQVGGRKGKNVRNHIWVLNGIICDVLSTKKKTPIDVQIFDYKQCFDSLWLQECLNDIYDSGVKDDKLALLFNINTHVRVSVKTPVGKTREASIHNVITQGDVFGPILCSNQVDTFGKECLEEGKYIYSYRGEVDIPPLGMVDDLICISECGHQTARMNAFINFKTNSKKLQFGGNKCKKMHVGHDNEDYKCQDLSVDRWSEVEVKNDETGEIEMKDIWDGEQVMEGKLEEKYLGDVISTDGRNLKNIKARIAKGKGIVSKIFTMLDGIPWMKHYFEVGMLLRDSLLVSSMLFNSEAWYNLTNAELDLLETIDVSFLRQLLKAPKGTPKEMLYLELGCIPLREVIRERRLGFLYYILNENPNSMIHKFFKCQMKGRKRKDWATTIIEDLEKLEISMNMEEISKMKKGIFMNMIKQRVKNKAFKELEQTKLSHSKVDKIEHNGISMQKYLQPNSCKIKIEEAQLIFKIRCRTTEAKVNLRGKYDNLECGACGLEEETQQHILYCTELNKDKPDQELKYEKILNGNVVEKLIIAQRFKDNVDRLENMKT